MSAKKKKPGAEAPKLTADEEVSRASAELESLRRLLEIRTHEASEARRSERAWRERAEAAARQLAHVQADSQDVVADMARQSKALQDHSLKRAAELERRVAALQATVSERDGEAAALRRAQAAGQEHAEAMARDYSARLAQLQLEFQAMLKEVLTAAQARLDAAHSAAMLGQRGT